MRWLLLVPLLAPAVGTIISPYPARAAETPSIPFNVVTTTSQVADLVRTIAGDRASVTGLMGEGVDPHTYKLTRSDVAKLAAADIVFYSGLLLEGKITDALIRMGSSGKPVHAVAGLLDPARLLTPPGFDGNADPHVWMDVSLWTAALNVVRDRLIEFDPAGADRYRANAADYAESWRGSTPTPGKRSPASPNNRACWSPPTTPSTIWAAPMVWRFGASKASAPSWRRACARSRRWSSCW